MQHKNVRWFVVIGVIFLLATNLAVFRLWIQTPPEHVYTGLGFSAAADKFVYYSMIRQGFEGRVFMENVHTSEAQQGLLFSPHWYLVGQTARLLGGSIPLAYHVHRIIWTIMLLWLLYRVVTTLYHRTWQQLGAYAAALFSSGLGWFYFVLNPGIGDRSAHWLQSFNRTPIDLYVTEYSVFTNTLQSPLFIISYILLLAIGMLYVRGHREGHHQWLVFLLTVIVGTIHPYDMPLVLFVCGSLAVWEMLDKRSLRSLWSLWPIGLGVGIAGMYHVWSFVNEPALSGWLAQNIAFSPSFGNYLWSIGPAGLLAVIGTWSLFRTRSFDEDHWRVIVLWAIGTLLLIYLPVSVNRRFANTMLLPISLLAWHGMLWMLTRIRTHVMRSAWIALCALLLVNGTVYQLSQHLFYVPTLDEKYIFYLDPYIIDGIGAIREQSDPDDILMPNFEFIGMLMAAYAPTKLFIGHEHQTVDYFQKKMMMEWFFAPPQGDDGLERRSDFLATQDIATIVVYKPPMRDSYVWLDTLPGLTMVHDSLILRIYTITQ